MTTQDYPCLCRAHHLLHVVAEEHEHDERVTSTVGHLQMSAAADGIDRVQLCKRAVLVNSERVQHAQGAHAVEVTIGGRVRQPAKPGPIMKAHFTQRPALLISTRDEDPGAQLGLGALFIAWRVGDLVLAIAACSNVDKRQGRGGSLSDGSPKPSFSSRDELRHPTNQLAWKGNRLF